jgi:hypothetical protein
MNGQEWNPWKLTAIGMVLVGATALVTGVVVARFTGGDRNLAATPASETPRPSTPTVAPAPARPTAPAAVAAAPPPGVRSAPRVAAGPTPSTVEACNRYAAEQTPSTSKTTEIVRDGAVGAVLGAAAGAATGAIAGGGKGAGTGAAIGGVLGAGGGSLYGLNENRKHDEQYRQAYAACMHSRGYTSSRGSLASRA